MGSYPAHGRGPTYGRSFRRSNNFVKPSPVLQSPSKMAVNIYGEWTTWESLSVFISGIPENVDTFTIWNTFQAYGTIDYIELFENVRGTRDGRGKIRFK